MQYIKALSMAGQEPNSFKMEHKPSSKLLLKAKRFLADPWRIPQPHPGAAIRLSSGRPTERKGEHRAKVCCRVGSPPPPSAPLVPSALLWLASHKTETLPMHITYAVRRILLLFFFVRPVLLIRWHKTTIVTGSTGFSLLY